MHTPDYEYFKKTLAGEPTDRPVLFESGVDGSLYEYFAGDKLRTGDTLDDMAYNTMWVHKVAGYDCIKTSPRSEFHLPRNVFNRPEGSQSISWNDNPVITNWDDLEKYDWNWIDGKPLDVLDAYERNRVDNMGILVSGSCGLIENAIVLVGYDNLCYKVYEDPLFIEELFKRIGERVYKFYDEVLQHPATDCIMMNDDWGLRATR